MTHDTRAPRYAGLRLAATMLATLALVGAVDVHPASGQPLLRVRVVAPSASSAALPARLAPTQHDTVLIDTCPGEWAASSVIVSAGGGDVMGVLAHASELRSAQGVSIPSANVDIRVVKAWYQGHSEDIGKTSPSDFRQRLVAELLLHDDGLIVVDHATERNYARMGPAGDTRRVWLNPKRLADAEQVLQRPQDFPIADAPSLQPFTLAAAGTQLWLTIDVPANTPPAVYEGAIAVHAPGVALGAVPVRLTVLPFRLVEPTMSYGIYYRATLDEAKASVGSEFRSEAQMRAELANMRRHGIRHPTLYQAPDTGGMLPRALELRRDAGLASGPLYFAGVTTHESAKTLAAEIPTVIALARRAGYSDVYVYGRDEARGAELRAQRSLWDLVHRLGGRLFVAGYSDAFDEASDALDVLVHAYQPSSSESRRWHAAGKRIYNYGNPQSGPENSFLFRLNYGLLLWANDYDGAMPYAYQHCFGSCWNDVDHPTYRDHNLTYPTVDGVIDTLAWEGLREGIQDVRFVNTLERLIDARTPSAAPVVQRARTYLDELRKRLTSGQSKAGKYNARMPIDLDEVRQRVIEHILAVRSA